MGFITGGFIVKDKGAVSDTELLSVLGRRKYRSHHSVTMEEATSRKFYAVGIARISNVTFVLGSEIAFYFSFESAQLSKSDKDLENLSKQSDILCFSINSIAATYAWSVFQNGNRNRVKCVVEKSTIFELGTRSEYEKGLELTDEGMIQLIENFTQLSYLNILSEKNRAEAYFD